MSESLTVDVWFETIQHSPERSERGGPLWDILSPAEQERHDAFLHESDRRQYLLAHGMKRVVLAKTLDCAAQELRFETDAKGKPYLTAPTRKAVSFSLSHGDGVVAVAVAPSAYLGVDVEAVNRSLRGEAVTRVMSDADATALTDADPEMLLRFWTAREAMMKAIGLGLSMPRDTISFQATRDRLEISSVAADYGPKENWHLLQRKVAGGSLLAAVVRHDGAVIWRIS